MRESQLGSTSGADSQRGGHCLFNTVARQSLQLCPVPMIFHSSGPLPLRAATIEAAALGLENTIYSAK